MKKGRHIFLAVFVVAILVLILWGFLELFPPQPQTADGLHIIHLDGQAIRVSLATTDATRELGLGGRFGLAPDEGMLFVFPFDGKYSFWMKDMRFSIDMLWISSDDHVVYIVQNVAPDTYPEAFTPTSQARYVLELPANYSAMHGVKVGDTIQLQ